MYASVIDPSISSDAREHGSPAVLQMHWLSTDCGPGSGCNTLQAQHTQSLDKQPGQSHGEQLARSPVPEKTWHAAAAVNRMPIVQPSTTDGSAESICTHSDLL